MYKGRFLQEKRCGLTFDYKALGQHFELFAYIVFELIMFQKSSHLIGTMLLFCTRVYILVEGRRQERCHW